MSRTLHYKFAANKTLASVVGPALDIVRATEATYLDSAGVMQIAANGVAAFDHNPITLASLGVSVWEARTNLAIYSGDVSNAAWVASNVTKDSDSVKDPTNTANTTVRLTATAANGTCLQTIASASATRSYAVYMKRVTGTGNIDLTVDNGATWTTKTLTAAWTRFDITQAAVTNPVIGVRLVADTDAIDFWGSDLQTGSFTTPHIPTVAASVTRNATNVNTTDMTWLNALEGTIYIVVSKPPSSGFNADYLASIDNGTTSERFVLDAANVSNAGYSVTDGAVQVDLNNSSSSWAGGAIHRVAAVYAVNNFEFYWDGTRTGTGDQTGTLPTATKLHVGANHGGSGRFFNGYIDEFAYDNVLQDNDTLEDWTLNGLPDQAPLFLAITRRTLKGPPKRSTYPKPTRGLFR